MAKNNFGIKSLLNNYSFKDFIKDIIIPLIISVLLTMVSMCVVKDSFGLLSDVVDLALEIFPALFAL